MSVTALIFEGAVAVVLVLVATLCWRLDRRLTALKNGQDGVRRTVVELAEATARAQESVRGLRMAGEDAGRSLDEKIARARALADELALLTDERARPAPRASRRSAGYDEDPREAERAPPAKKPRRRRVAAAEPAEPVAAEAAEILDRLRGVR